MFTLAHTSDWHATTLEGASARELANKRFFGWLSWKRRRRKRHRPEVLERLLADLRAQQPDHVVVTGDLTNVALEQEFEEATRSLHALGDARFVSLVPGNHDAYVGLPAQRSWDRWAPYLRDDDAESAAPAPAFDDFPTLRVRKEVAIVGVCSALPTPLFMAGGEVGQAQLERLEARLRQLRERGLFRVVALHHPPTNVEMPRRRRLRDWRALQSVLVRAGAELIVHGHRHRTWLGSVPGPDGDIRVAGVRSASDVGIREDKRAQYHLYHIEPDPGARGGYRVTVELRGYDRAADCFASEGERAFA